MYFKREIMIQALGMIINEKYVSPRYGKYVQRSQNFLETSEAQAKINQRLKDNDKIYKILGNFNARTNKAAGDWFITLTYTPGRKPKDLAEAHGNLRKFVRRIKRKFKNCKFMAKTENTATNNLHHHLFISAEVPVEYMYECWKQFNSRIDIRNIYCLDDFKLANYFVKNEKTHSITECKYIMSRNLDKPVVKVKKIKSKRWTKEPKARKGYEVIAVENFFDYFGFEKQMYIERRLAA